MKTNREYITPAHAFKIFGVELPDWIVFNPNLTKKTGAQYEIIRQTTHDGTFTFTKDLIRKTIVNLSNKTSYFIPESQEGVVDVKYEIGFISLATIFGKVDLPCGNFPGEKQRTRLPVKCILIKSNP